MITSRPRRAAALAATAALALAPLATLTVAADASTAPPSSPATARAEATAAGSLWAPRRAEAQLYGSRESTRVSLPVRFVAGEAPLELWSNRPSYGEQIRTVWKAPDGDVTLPTGSMSTFNALDDFVRISAKNLRTGKRLKSRLADVCLNSYGGERVRPDAPAYSPYPQYCFANPYSLGSVQGVQAGWSSPLFGEEGRGVRLTRGQWEVTTTVTPRYARALRLSPQQATATTRVAVTREHDHDDHDHGEGEGHSHGAGRTPAPDARPAAAAPTGPEQADVEGPQPNLRSLPAWGIDMAGNGNYLRFAATVWNAGDSPLVVDGFRRAGGKPMMDAYQYFFDASGEQTGYQQIGSFEFDTKPSHQHWHFRDFASYTLLRADKSTAVVSKKEAFCLANTDSIDQTVPGADWNPENTDLSTDCGSPGSQSLRQVLSAGWGDTYAQFRAGQSFSLKGLPNGTYYIATIANPADRLVESDYDDNVALRRIVIGGKPGARTVKVPKIGIIEEPTEQW
ncbi:lysyl oxidase family protein [Nocardioides nanhaiensis]|uniref:Lysyl oxidase n=1 Tax=Nocardioides nanhaiensis TaxID=1476871 RepID=A0ABP8WSL7_9ACTN